MLHPPFVFPMTLVWVVYLSALAKAHAAQLSDLPCKVSICADAGGLSRIFGTEPMDSSPLPPSNYPLHFLSNYKCSHTPCLSADQRKTDTTFRLTCSCRAGGMQSAK